MSPAEYNDFWTEPGKWCGDDIRFSASADNLEVLEFDGIEITSQAPWPIVLNGRHDCRTGEVTFNFVAKGVGAFSRFDLGGTVHKDSGRFHQHTVINDSDVRQQLPNAIPRDDLRNRTARQAWQIICQEASITYTGLFWEPEELC